MKDQVKAFLLLNNLFPCFYISLVRFSCINNNQLLELHIISSFSRVLRKESFILSEKTRKSKKFLSKFKIKEIDFRSTGCKSV